MDWGSPSSRPVSLQPLPLAANLSDGVAGICGLTFPYCLSTYGGGFHMTGNSPAGTAKRFYRMLLP